MADDELPLEESLLPTSLAKAAARGEELDEDAIAMLRATPKRAPHLPTLDETIRRGRAAGKASRGQYKASGYRRFR
ncbi:hypothetical protein [Pseudokineococcus lusitanus]|uniref:Uncharacterized protein n=1 Tax=Pseudokineococcus lusitanus TaxID=763993 RepID=A0A3N1HTR4_9ACTN|nr:hypothetical protein [Pseudokineococcus lusitanus]ROP45923.1 hypothetical protein EDC03_0538 [Pseudokineococcus lusitanus]